MRVELASTSPARESHRWRGPFVWAVLLANCLGAAFGADRLEGVALPVETGEGVVYTNARVAGVPWSIHLVQVNRKNPAFEMQTPHALNRVLGLCTLSQLAAGASSASNTPLAALNGDYFERGGPYAGHPRGLQIVAGDLVSAPMGGATFWIDQARQPHLENVVARFRVTWPDGGTSAFGLNGPRGTYGVVLYTSSLGPSTRTSRGRELVLEPVDGASFSPLAIGATVRARVREVRLEGNTPLTPQTMVLSVGPSLRSADRAITGTALTLTLATAPELRGARSALSGGPILIHGGVREKLAKPDYTGPWPFEWRSRWERHPRSAVGWNATHYFLLQVDGHQANLSAGMTLDELGDYLAQLGCTEAMNLDGGGSSALWFQGQIVSEPSDGCERPIANGLVVATQPAFP